MYVCKEVYMFAYVHQHTCTSTCMHIHTNQHTSMHHHHHHHSPPHTHTPTYLVPAQECHQIIIKHVFITLFQWWAVALPYYALTRVLQYECLTSTTTILTTSCVCMCVCRWVGGVLDETRMCESMEEYRWYAGNDYVACQIPMSPEQQQPLSP